MSIIADKLAEIAENKKRIIEAESVIANEVETMKKRLVEQDKLIAEQVSDRETTIAILRQYEPNFSMGNAPVIISAPPLVPNRIFATKNATDAAIMVLLEAGVGVNLSGWDLGNRIVKDSLKQGWTYTSIPSFTARMSQEFRAAYSVRGKNEITQDYWLRRTGSVASYRYYIIKRY